VGATEQPLVAFKGSPIIFPEVLGGTIPAGGLKVDHDGSSVVTDPVVTSGVVSSAIKDTVLPAGLKFNSYFFHFDPVGTPGFAYYIAEIVFSRAIIGVQLFSSSDTLTKPAGNSYTGTLEAGDAVAILNGSTTIYPINVNFRGLEEDYFELAISGNTVLMAGSVSGPQIDQIRFFVSAVPEPASVLTWGFISLAAGVASVSYRRNRQA
jgi:hypothetical protein